MITARVNTIAFVLGALTTFAGCSDGGSSSSPPPPPPTATAPTITTQPLSATVAAGSPASMQVAATGNGTLTYAWRFNGTAIAGATASTYTVASAAPANVGTYDVVVTNSLNGTTATTTSSGAALAVVTAPEITTQPASTSVSVGAQATLRVVATGSGALTYAWRREGVAMPGETGAAYPIGAATHGDAGSYDVVVTNSVNGVGVAVTSASATVTVAPATTMVTAETTVLAGSAGHQASAPAQAGTFTWTVANGTITAGQGTNQITYTAGQPGEARLQVRITGVGILAVGAKDLRAVAAIPVANIFAPPVVHPADFDVRASAAAIPGNTYTWSWQNLGATVVPPASLVDQPFFYGVTAAIGAYQLQVNVTDANSNVRSLTRDLAVASNVFLKDKRDPAPRSFHTATLMNDGRVLFVGGDAGIPDAGSIPGTQSRILGTTEIYDPVTERWADAGIIAARFSHSATLLNDGRVLIAGGTSPTNSILASTSIYDPEARTWTPAAPMLAARSEHTATLLTDGRVLVTGGVNGSGVSASSEIYDPAGNAWSTTGSLQTARVAHSATRLDDGRVLVAAGNSSSGQLASAELFSPATGTWSAAGSLTSTRSRAGAVLLPNGRVLHLGGTVNEYDPATNSWTSWIIRSGGNAGTVTLVSASGTSAILLPDGTVLASGNYYSNQTAQRLNITTYAVTQTPLTSGTGATSTRLHDGNVLVVGGFSSTSQAAVAEHYVSLGTAAAYVWNGNFTSARGSSAPRGEHAVAGTLPDGRMLFAGGADSRVPTLAAAHARATLFDPQTNSFGEIAATMTTSREFAAAATLQNGRMLIAGGTDGVSGVRASAEYYDQPANAFSAAGSLAGPRFLHTLTALGDGTALAVGGKNATSCNCTMFQATVDRYDPVANSWSAANPLITARDSHTATLLPDGRVLVVGGYGGTPNTLADTGAILASAELFDPATGNWTATGSMSTARRDHIAISLGAGRVLVAGGTNGTTTLASAEIYDVATGLWTPATSMNAPRQAASAALLANGNVLVVNGLNGVSSPVFGSGTGEVYDVVGNSWSTPVPVTVPRTGSMAMSLPDGRVMVVGGMPNFTGTPEFYR